MRLVLSPVLAFHWMAVFGMLTVVSTTDPGRGGHAALELLGVSFSDPELAGGIRFSAVLSLGLTLVTALFLWSLLVSVFGANRRSDAEEIARYAFAAGAAALTTLLLVGAVEQVHGLFTAVGMMLTALTASYLAVFAERTTLAPTSQPEPAAVDDTIKAMAAGAAHNALLARISGREIGLAEETRP